MPGNPPTLGEARRSLGARLASDFEARLLLEHVLGLPGAQLPLRAGEPLSPAAALRLDKLADRRLAGEPLQYLLGEWEFYSLPFHVGPGVLIPRQDTETLVDTALEALADRRRPQVLDLCAGSGCVAVAIAHSLPGAAVTALELSADAFSYLVRNIRRNGVPVQAVQGDLHAYTHPHPLDLITANPPYIPRAALAGLQPEVRREPREALDGGADGLDYYRAIARRYHSQLAPGGRLLLEVGFGQADSVRDILAGCGYAECACRSDLAGVPRVVLARRRQTGTDQHPPEEDRP